MSVEDSTITVHPLSKNPTKAWDTLKHQQILHQVEPLPLNTPINPNAVRFVCVSDTHSVLYRMKHPIPPGDVFIHAGDFTRYGDTKEVSNFNSFLGTLPHPHKVVIAGNHELSFDQQFAQSMQLSRFPTEISIKNSSQVKTAQGLLTKCTYLEDELVTIHGLRIYGTPWQPRYCGWAFNINRGQECLEKWNKIPQGIDVLLTHTPPLGHGDLAISAVRAGCVELLATVQKRVKPKYHVFGHIHEGYGTTTDGRTVFINASTCNVNYSPVNPPIIFDIPLPQGHTKN